ncbi:hypothetical protein ACHAXT_009594 [Thalassiosira profunda]
MVALLLLGAAVGLARPLAAFVPPAGPPTRLPTRVGRSAVALFATAKENDASPSAEVDEPDKERIVIVGGGWGGLSTAHALATSDQASQLEITLVDAAPRVGGLVRDGYKTINGTRAAEAGQHGFWDNYHNIFQFLEELPTIESIGDVLTGYAEQGQYSPRGLEAVWPVYREMQPQLPTGLAQAFYTKFTNLSPLDRASAFPLVLAFSEFDDSAEAWSKYDNISFRDLCMKLGVSKRCYDEAFEPMILTGLFAPGAECSAAAALGMAYFFVLKSQNSFDVRWCKGNIGELIMDPWVSYLEEQGVTFATSTQVRGFELDEDENAITGLHCVKTSDGKEEVIALGADKIVLAVGGAALNSIVRNSPELSRFAEFRKFANLRGLGVLATRLYFDRVLDTPYSANACWGFDDGVGMTYFDITKLHSLDGAEGSVIEVDYYHAASLLVMSDEAIVDKVKKDLNTILGKQCNDATVLDAAVVRLPSAVNWYAPGSYAHMPDAQSSSIPNVFFAGDLVRSRHGSWSQELAFVTGIEAANQILGRKEGTGIIPLEPDEPHVVLGREALNAAKTVVGRGDRWRAPSLADFLW